MSEEEKNKYLLSWKANGMPDKQIASRLNIPEEEVSTRYLSILQAFHEVPSNSGYDYLAAQFVLFCNQYQLLGETMKNLSTILSEHATTAEVCKVIMKENDTLQAAKKLSESFIILRKANSPDINAVLKQMRGN